MRRWWYKRRLRAVYLHWLNIGADMDCGLQMARTIRPSAFARTERRCAKYAQLLRGTGDKCPLVPGEEGFK